MHEMGIALEILETVRQSVPPGKDLKVKNIYLRVGKLTAVVPESLRACMEIITKDSFAEGVEVTLTEVPVVVECEECGDIAEIEELPFACRGCGSGRVEIVQGREMIVESIEVEEKEDSEKL